MLDSADKKLRSDQFPYHLSNTSHTIGNSSLRSRLQLKDSPKYESPSTYMVVNFDNDFEESMPIAVPKMTKVDEKKMKETLENFNRNSAGKINKSLKAPNLNTSYVYPKVILPAKEQKDTVMFRRASIETQTVSNMNKLNFEGLSGYQTWTADTVEPFLKDLRKAIKANRPQDINAYIIRYCQAMADGVEPPETIDEIIKTDS